MDEEERRNRIQAVDIQRKLKKEKRKQNRKIRFRGAIADFIHQIKVTLITILIASLAILFLCASAWYILKNNEKQSLIACNKRISFFIDT